MAQTKKAIRDAYDKKTYKQYAFRVRRETELCERVEKFKAASGTSLNYLCLKLLAEHFDVPFPAPY